MKQLKWTWKKIVSLVLGFFGIGTLVSCYGMPYANEAYFSGTVYGDIDNDGTCEPVKDICVSVNRGEVGSVLTDENGDFSIFIDYDLNKQIEEASYLITFEDKDDAANGEFKTFMKKVSCEDDNLYVNMGRITLERK